MLSRTRSGLATLAAGVLGVLLLPHNTHAAAFALYEEGAEGMGFAGAFTAQASDPSAIFHNAAGLAFLKGTQISIGGTLITPSTSFTGANPYPGSGVLETMDVGSTPIPAVYVSHQVSDRFVVGVGWNTPFGLKTGWTSPSTFTGRFLSEDAELKGFSINPTVAYKLADRLSVGVGLDIRLTSLSLERRIGVVNPFTQTITDAADVALQSNTATDFGWDLGVIAKPTENLSLGVSYRAQVNQTFTGTANFSPIETNNPQLDALIKLQLPSGSLPVTSAIDFPSILSLGASYAWRDWVLEADMDFYGWSSFASLPITITNRPDLSSSVEEAYQDTHQYRVGIQRQIDDMWVVRAGYYYDQSPAPTQSVSPLLPDATRQGFCVGAGWHQGHFKVDAAGWYVKFDDRSTDGIERDNYNGTYTGKAITVGISLGYTF